MADEKEPLVVGYARQAARAAAAENSTRSLMTESMLLAMDWKRVAERRYRRSTTYLVGFCAFVLGMAADFLLRGLATYGR